MLSLSKHEVTANLARQPVGGGGRKANVKEL
jgi:hypothetical protein